MKPDDVVHGGWSPSHSVAVLLLATARACPQPVPPARILALLVPHASGLGADVVAAAAGSELDTHFRQGGLQGVVAALQSHCGRLKTFLDDARRRQVVAEMVEVARAGTDSPEALRRVCAFPYAAARAWGLGDVSEALLSQG